MTPQQLRDVATPQFPMTAAITPSVTATSPTYGSPPSRSKVINPNER
ncbi:hypothetical protein H7I39_06855 [Mycobacterium doricum]|nr:hypothetical protein [Mycolicibacterium doricum]MCV7267885.1 hypothetical protein [Mycolicibacterium doricum]